MYSDGVVFIDNLEDYRNCLAKYKCRDLSDLDDTLWYTYGVSLEMAEKIKEQVKLFESDGTI